MKYLLTLLGLVAVFPGFQAVAQFEAPPANVRVARASMQMMAAQTLVPGTVVSRNDAKLSAEVTGRLLEVVDVGTVVTKGDMVAKIEDTPVRLRRDELRAEVEVAQFGGLRFARVT